MISPTPSRNSVPLSLSPSNPGPIILIIDLIEFIHEALLVDALLLPQMLLIAFLQLVVLILQVVHGELEGLGVLYYAPMEARFLDDVGLG